MTLSTNTNFDAKHILNRKIPLYKIDFENEDISIVSLRTVEYILKFEKQKGSFTVGNLLRQIVPGGTTVYGTIIFVHSGVVYLKDVVGGTFVGGYPVYEATYEGELLTNEDFALWTSDDDPEDWAVGYEDSSNYITEDSSGARFVSDFSTGLQMNQAPLTIGDYFKYVVAIADVTSGYLEAYASARIGTFNAEQTYTVIFQASSPAFVLARGAGNTDVVVGSTSLKRVTNSALALGGVEYTYAKLPSVTIFQDEGTPDTVFGGAPDTEFQEVTGEIVLQKNYLEKIEGLSQKVTPEEGKSSISSVSATVVDRLQEITALLSTDTDAYFQKRKTTVYAGYAGMSMDDLIAIFTGRISNYSQQKLGVYNFAFADEQKAMQRKIFRDATDDNPLFFSGNPINMLLGWWTSTGLETNGAYDYYDEGSGLAIEESSIFISAIEKLRDDYYPGDSYYMSFEIREPETAKTFFETQIYKVLNLYLVTRGNGTISLINHKPPLPSTGEIITLNEDSMIGDPTWDGNLEDLVNEVIVESNYDIDNNEFDLKQFFEEATSLANRKAGKKTIKIESKGFHTDNSPGSIPDRATSAIARRINGIFERYANPPTKLSFSSFFTKYLAEGGDIVSFSHALVPNLESGTRGISNVLMEVISRSVNWDDGKVNFTLLDTAFGRDPFQVISPTMTITVVNNYTSDFSADADSFDQNTADPDLQVTGDVDGIGGEDDCLKVYANAGDRLCQIRRTTTVTAEYTYKIVFDYYCEATSGLAFIGIGAHADRENSGDNIAVVEGAWQTNQTLTFTVSAGQSRLRMGIFTTIDGDSVDTLLSGKAIYFKNIVMTGQNFTVSTADALKYANFTLPEVQICDAMMRQQVSNVTVLAVNTTTGVLQIDDAGALSVGWMIVFADYDNVTAEQKKWGYIAGGSDDTLGTDGDAAHLIVP